MDLENNIISYEEFCNKYAKEMNNTTKYNIVYGSKLEMPIQSDTILFVASNLKSSDELSNIISDTSTHTKNKKVVAIAEKDSDLAILKGVVETHKFRTEKSHQYLATAKTIVTDSILPFWFIKREEQTVIYLCSKNTLSQDNRINRIPFSTALLKASAIIVNDENQLNDLHKLYGIKDVFLKPIFETSSNIDKQNLILGKSINAKKYLFEKEKRTIAIYVKWDESPFAFPCIDFLTSQLDHTKYDVTLILSKKPADKISELQIETLNKHVRILKRTGTYCGTIEQYRKTQYLVRNMLQFNDVCSKYLELDENFIEREREKIWGDLSFDYVIGFGNIRPFWLSLLDVKSTKGKYYIESRPESSLSTPGNDNSSDDLAYFNQSKLYNMIFDKILFTNPNMVSFGIDKMHLDPNKIGEFFIAANLKDADFQVIPLTTATYRDQKYYLLGQTYFTPNKSHVDVIPVPRSNSYITDIRNQNLEQLLERFSTSYKNGEKLYIHGETWDMIEPIAIMYNLADRVFSLGNTNWQLDQMGQFYQKLNGYITLDNHEHANAIRTFTECLGLPSFELSENGIKQLEPEFLNLSEYKHFVQNELNQLFS